RAAPLEEVEAHGAGVDGLQLGGLPPALLGRPQGIHLGTGVPVHIPEDPQPLRLPQPLPAAAAVLQQGAHLLDPAVQFVLLGYSLRIVHPDASLPPLLSRYSLGWIMTLQWMSYQVACIWWRSCQVIWTMWKSAQVMPRMINSRWAGLTSSTAARMASRSNWARPGSSPINWREN